MARPTQEIQHEPLVVSIDECRIRLQTGEPTVFLDVRRAEDRAARSLQIAGSLRLTSDDRVFRPPCPKHRYIVVYCA